MSADVALTRPVMVHDKEVSVLTLREPTSGDIMEIGAPQLLIPSADGTSVGVEVRPAIIGRYIMKLASIPLPSVKALAPADFNKCQGVVMGFLTAGDGEA